MYKKLTSGLLILLLAFSLAGCKKIATKDQIISLGKSEGNVYSNDFFNMTITIPDKWVVATDDEKMEVIKVGQEVIAGDDESKAKKLDLSVLKSVYLLMASEKGMKVQSTSNPNFITVAEKISLAQGVKNGTDYLEAVKVQLKALASTVPYNLDKEVYTEKVDGKNFSVLEATIENGTIKMTQKYYACVLNGYALSFISTSTNAESAKTLDEVIKSVTFK